MGGRTNEGIPRGPRGSIMGDKLTQIRGLVRRKKSVAGGKKGVRLKFGLKCNRDSECFL